ALPANAEIYESTDAEETDWDCNAGGQGPYELPTHTVKGRKGSGMGMVPAHLELQRQRGEHLLRQQGRSPARGEQGANEGIRGTAKWQVLCGPGDRGGLGGKPRWVAPSGSGRRERTRDGREGF
ncbi:MAG: hypothetical protein LQ340_006204, partial [Diploschistes diacapsis]